jgi:simple sugar transport system permease protein
VSPILAIVMTIVVTGLLFLAFGKPPGHALDVFLIQPLTATNGIAELCVKAAPLIMIGVGIALAARANVWNIGAEGQYILGAIFGGGLALAKPDWPALALFPLMMLAGVIGGMLYAAIVAVLRVTFNANEILTSLMLNYVAQLLLIYLVSGPWRDPTGYGFPQTAMFSTSAAAPILMDGTRLHLGVGVALAVGLVGWLVLSYTITGFQIRVQGSAPRAARFAGFSDKKIIWLSLLVSGGLAGLAGLFEVAGPIGQLTPQISPGYGYTAIIVAFLGRLHPLGTVLAGFLLALSYLGGEAAQIDLGLPSAITGIFQGVLLFFLLGCDALILYRVKVSLPTILAGHKAAVIAPNPAE